METKMNFCRDGKKLKMAAQYGPSQNQRIGRLGVNPMVLRATQNSPKSGE
jgi:hypothetical protein